MSQPKYKFVAFTSNLGITHMVRQEVPAVAPAEDTIPIDHGRWVYAIGAAVTVALQLAVPFFLAYG